MLAESLCDPEWEACSSLVKFRVFISVDCVVRPGMGSLRKSPEAFRKKRRSRALVFTLHFFTWGLLVACARCTCSAE